jgi:hypothetical protein
MPGKLSVRCPPRHVVMHAETLMQGTKEVPIEVTRTGAEVVSRKALRGKDVALQLTCRKVGEPLTLRDGLAYGTPKADKISTRRRPAAVIFGGPGDDRLRLHNRSEVAYGGLGRDRITVRARESVGVGGPGRDRIVAKTRKRTVLIGGPGRDRLIGSKGVTLINAKDGERDIVVCRSKRNRVLADRKDVLRGPCSVIGQR